jgi:hypothetical protein
MSFNNLLSNLNKTSSTDFEILKKYFSHICEIKEYNNFGNLIIYVKNIDIKEIKLKVNEFMNYIFLCCYKCLNISKKYNNNTYCAHVYLDGFNMKNFSISLFKKMSKILNDWQDEAILNTCYIYANNNKFIVKLLEVVKLFINSETRKKMKIIN